MNVEFIEKTETGKRFETIEDGDVVILPAFGASLEEMQLLDSKVHIKALTVMREYGVCVAPLPL